MKSTNVPEVQLKQVMHDTDTSNQALNHNTCSSQTFSATHTSGERDFSRCEGQRTVSSNEGGELWLEQQALYMISTVTLINATHFYFRLPLLSVPQSGDHIWFFDGTIAVSVVPGYDIPPDVLGTMVLWVVPAQVGR